MNDFDGVDLRGTSILIAICAFSQAFGCDVDDEQRVSAISIANRVALIDPSLNPVMVALA